MEWRLYLSYVIICNISQHPPPPPPPPQSLNTGREFWQRSPPISGPIQKAGGGGAVRLRSDTKSGGRGGGGGVLSI